MKVLSSIALSFAALAACAADLQPVKDAGPYVPSPRSDLARERRPIHGQAGGEVPDGGGPFHLETGEDRVLRRAQAVRPRGEAGRAASPA